MRSRLNRPGFREGSNSGEWSHKEVPEFSPEVRESAVRMVMDRASVVPADANLSHRGYGQKLGLAMRRALRKC